MNKKIFFFFSSRLFDPSDIWKVFYKQADAFAFVHKARLVSGQY